MTLRFSEDGPVFPSELVDSLLGGEVVFLCGTGVSAPQMPDFRVLVEGTYDTLGVDRTDSELTAFTQGRFEEVLGSLSRRLSDAYAVTRTVSELLAVPEHPSLDQHRTILRLSRDLDNRVSVVTTNFDTLLERAAGEIIASVSPGDISFAGQALPAPGSASFSGIIHIHGRLADRAIGLGHAPLVLTSADYGDAYMRSGWASRFLFDLARCKAIVLVGYSANDAPVRYFLNVLEADRARFPDLKPVYAFDAYVHDPEEATRPWDTLAVMPLPYSKINPDSGEHDHSPLWRDLAELAEFTDRPRHSRRKRAHRILERPAAEANVHSRQELGWLFRGRHDLWPVALDAIRDSEWFNFFQDSGLWSTEDAHWVIADWVSRNFQDRDRCKCACEWQPRLNQPFTDQIAMRLLHAPELDESWTRVWRLFCLVEPLQHHDPAYYAVQKWLTSGVVLFSDLREAVGLLAPRMVLTRSHHEALEKREGQPIRRLGDIVETRLTISNWLSAEKLVDSLCAIPDRAIQILDLATTELRSALELQVELELIGKEHDSNDFAVPSIEHHAQNQHHEGVNYLVQLLVKSFCQAATLDREYTRRVAISWRSLSGRIGLRLCLHAMGNVQLFDADEAMSTLLSASDMDFWEIRREIALLVKDRAGTASPALVSRVEERIRQNGGAYFDRYTIEPGEADWRSHARDAAVWLRLNMLQDAGVLSEIGSAELSAIKERRDYLNRAVEDRDFFGSYSSGVHVIVGNPAPIAEAAEDDRLRVAQKLIHSPEFDLQQGWSAFCRSDPQGAFDSLCKEDLTPENRVLWNEFLQGLAVVDAESKAIRDELAMRALAHLADFNIDVLKPMASGLVYLIFSTRRQGITNVINWLDRLWKMISDQADEPLDLTSDLYEQAINTNVGTLTQTLLQELAGKHKDRTISTEPLLQIVRRICSYEGSIGQLGRAVLAIDVAFLLATDRPCVMEFLAPRITAPNPEGAALRDVMLTYGSITPSVTRAFGQAILEGMIESHRDGRTATTIASGIIRPALAEIRGDIETCWGLNVLQVKEVLRKASQSIRCGTLEILSDWLRADDTLAEDAWRMTFWPFFDRIWPKEREFLDASLTPHFIQLAVNAGNAFPEAFEFLYPYVSPYDQGHGDLHPIHSSEIPEKFPRETLSLLWLVCGPGSQGTFFEISEIIDRLIVADPDLEVDRRLQWLEAQNTRFD